MKRILELFVILILPMNVLICQDKLIINEFMAINNSTLQDEDSTYSDWIEIFNADTLPINLAGWHLTDDTTDYIKWAFPCFTIDTGEYIIVFASGKDRYSNKDKMHANFKLSGAGEFLALSNPDSSIYSSVFKPAFPVQFNDISYGLQSATYVYFNNPTPGAANQDSGGLYTSPPTFSTSHGYFHEPFQLSLSGKYEDADLYFSTDASTPDSTNGTLYTGPININTTTVVRAVAVHDNIVSNTITQSYIFPDSVIRQANDQPGYPEFWLRRRSYGYDSVNASYGMKQETVSMPEVSEVLIESLKSLPVISLVSDIDNYFSFSTDPDSGGIYMYTGIPLSNDGDTFAIGKGWMRPASIEYFNPGETDESIDFQSNCGVRLHGNASTDRQKTLKHPFRIAFKAEYGPTKLKAQLFGKGSPKQYDWFVLRSGFDRRLGLQLKDPYVKNSMRAMGQYSAYNRFVHVYLNGMYWGMYNLCEYMDENCMRDNLGGKADDYDILKDFVEVRAGDTIAWSEMANITETVSYDTSAYQKLLGNNPDGTPNPAYPKYLDPENLIDYVLLNYFTETGDWDYKNWVAARRKTDSEGFQFIIWDAEYTLRDISLKSSGMDWRPTDFYYTLLFDVPEFQNLLVSRINKHLFEDGALTPKPSIERYANGLAEIDTALIADQARWVADEDDIWNETYHGRYAAYFSERTEELFRGYINGDYYPQIDVPEFNTDDRYIPEDFQLLMTAPEGGTIRYTTDGTDPGHFSLATSPSIKVYDSTAIPLPEVGATLIVKARSKVDSLWSVVIRKVFIIGNDPRTALDNSFAANNLFYSYPNPMKEITNIKFELEGTSSISMDIYNSMGQFVTNLVKGTMQPGEHTINWYADNLPSGVYFCVLENFSNSNRDRIILVRE